MDDNRVEGVESAPEGSDTEALTLLAEEIKDLMEFSGPEDRLAWLLLLYRLPVIFYDEE